MAALSPVEPTGRQRAADVWVAVDEGAAVATARRRAAALATDAGFPPDRVGEAEIVASELASNLVKHAGGGDLVLRARAAGAIQVVAIDSGPGTRNLAALIDDGVSTTGTLGVGLGAVRRLATRLDLWSEPARGAVVVAELSAGGAPVSSPVGSLLRTLRGESVCGDAVAWRPTSRGWLVLVADGLGHGPLAAEPSGRAAHVVETGSTEAPGEIVQRLHHALSGTRGAAVAVSHVDLERRVLVHAAVGNISGRLIGGSDRGRSLMTQPGIVGHKLPRVQETTYELGGARLLVLHSDGLTDKWSDAAVPSVDTHGPDLCAATLVRDAGTRRDDAGVLTLRIGG